MHFLQLRHRVLVAAIAATLVLTEGVMANERLFRPASSTTTTTRTAPPVGTPGPPSPAPPFRPARRPAADSGSSTAPAVQPPPAPVSTATPPKASTAAPPAPAATATTVPPKTPAAAAAPATKFVIQVVRTSDRYTEGAANNTAIERHPHWPRDTQSECGHSAADRIVGGQDATLGQYPWLALLGIRSEWDYWRVLQRTGRTVPELHLLASPMWKRQSVVMPFLTIL